MRFSKLSNTQYDYIKWLIIKVSPALVIAISGLGILLDFNVTVIVGVIGIITTFLGTILGISNKHYEEEEPNA